MSHFSLPKLFITVIINVLLISLFIGLFFFTYGAYIEKKVVKSQMNFLATDISSLIKLFGKSVNDIFKKHIQNVNVPDLSAEDNKAASANKKTLLKAVIANIICTILVIIAVIFTYMKSKKDFSMRTLLIQNFILLIFIGFTEFSFLTFFGAKYVSINPNSIKHNVVDNIDNLFTLNEK